MKIKLKWLILLLVIIVIAVAYIFFNQGQQQNGTAVAPAPAGLPTAADREPPAQQQAIRAETNVAEAENSAGTPTSPDPIPFDYNGAMQEVETILSAAELSAEDEVKLRELQDQLTAIASINPAMRAQMIASVEADPTSRLAEFERVILAQLDRPEVIELGLKLAQSADRDVILGGLDLLAERNADNQQTLAVTEQLLDKYRDDADVLVAAMSAMPAIATDKPTADRIINTLSELTTHDNDAVRSASIFAVARRAQDPKSLSATVQALNSNIPDDRSAAAMALQNSNVVTDGLRDKLVAHMTDQDEIWEVRRMAADSLAARFALTDEQKDQLLQFRDEQTRLSLEGSKPTR